MKKNKKNKNIFNREDLSDSFENPIEKNGYRLVVFPDELVDSPEDWEENTTIVSFHRSYGSNHGYSSMEEAIKDARSKKLKSYVLYGYDHSGLSLSLTDEIYPYNDRWDSGIYGVLITDKNKKDAEEFIKLYNKYLSGDIYCFNLYKIKKCECCGSDISEAIESSGGFYDPDEMVDCINYAINHQK